MQSHPQSFFSRLPYDVRAIIYTYLEPNKIPPFSPDTASLGFLLSCRAAKEELEDYSHNNLQSLISEFNKTAPCGAKIGIKPGALQCITVYLPFNAFSGLDWSTVGFHAWWKREVMTSLHFLFAHYFEAVRIHISNDLTERLPRHDTLFDCSCFEVKVHGLLRDVSYMIQRVNLDRQRNGTGSDVTTFDVLFAQNNTPDGKQYPTTLVRTKRISLTWDFRSEAIDRDLPVILNGRLHELPFQPVHSLGPDRPANIHAEAVSDIDTCHPDESSQQTGKDLLSTKRPAFYHLHDSQRLVGEMCLQNNSRWPISESFWDNKLLNGQETVSEYISSEGLGRRPRVGLNSITPAEYDEREIEVQQAFWTT